MSILKKRVADSVVLHAALAETDPSSIDLILISPTRYQAAFRPLPLRLAPALATRIPAVRDHRYAMPTRRRRTPASKKTALPQ